MTAKDIDLLAQRLDQVDEKLDAILTQAKETNGRVTELERFRERIMGALIPLTILPDCYREARKLNASH